MEDPPPNKFITQTIEILFLYSCKLSSVVSTKFLDLWQEPATCTYSCHKCQYTLYKTFLGIRPIWDHYLQPIKAKEEGKKKTSGISDKMNLIADMEDPPPQEIHYAGKARHLKKRNWCSGQIHPYSRRLPSGGWIDSDRHAGTFNSHFFLPTSPPARHPLTSE
ncbi:hypothetical protein CEXT_285061 [Caerostris extrusa]|uniref:Uncharacterized protein n=1 Tax=Caerostris extrusa TaxID=172846 RepID=A0AAV4XW59_CAEEX|nr:hypothetical protein CEXT_285061 [Caerostris extrusa]